MSRMDYRTLVDRGRKSGLHTGELYASLSTDPRSAADLPSGMSDGNGFVVRYQNGQYSYQPLGPARPTT
jgi:hypothetical protein